jgi:menaquinone-9 beta-reductase
MSDRVDVLVVGAGPGGSATATALARSGARVLLVEAAAHPRPKACAEYASPRILEELDRLGLPRATWQKDALPLDGMRVVRGGDAVDIRYTDRSGRRPAWGVERTKLDAALASHAGMAGATLVERTTFVAADRDGGPWRVELRTAEGRGRTVRADVLVGADGARSAVARVLGVERRTVHPHRLGLIAHYEAVPELLTSGEMHVGRRHYVGLAPLPGGRVNVGMALPDEGGSARDRFESAIAALPAVADRLRGRRRLTPIRGASPIGHRVARAAGAGWLLVGDAAGFIDPFTGEGIYRALRSARAAGEALLQGVDGADHRYLAERRRAFAAKDALTWTVQAMLAAPPVFGYAIRRLAARPQLAAVLGASLGDCRPAHHALDPRFLASVLRP